MLCFATIFLRKVAKVFFYFTMFSYAKLLLPKYMYFKSACQIKFQPKLNIFRNRQIKSIISSLRYFAGRIYFHMTVFTSPLNSCQSCDREFKAIKVGYNSFLTALHSLDRNHKVLQKFAEQWRIQRA